MGRRKLKPFNDANPTLDLKSLIHKNSLFFDKLIELIPAKFYLPLDEKERPWFQGLSKAEKALAKKESRENIKKARRDRLDPGKSLTTTLDLLKQSLEKEKSHVESEDEEIEVKPIVPDLEDEKRSVTYEELRQRLHRRIEELRAGRNTNTGGSDKANKKNEKNEKKGNLQKKRKRDSGPEEKTSASDSTGKMEKVQKDAEDAVKRLTFSHIKLGNEEKQGKKKRKFSKVKQLENAMTLEEAKKDPEVANKHMWKAALHRAQGVKVHDDPKLLKQSIKKEKKRQQKNTEKWKERVETTQKLKAEKQQKRSDNIAEKINQKKMRRIAKREKKLLRPGFEGRKEGFVNEDAA
ncbi:hypothetical protein SLEP1_g287 [Rubroshorea leprosula]|uniref:Surfeit locus protein 6 n=1 Tax=Rubroshorea leprosula TaxID=152421 RepID=A0AAV5HIR8_9ROSI|nr:hypothetical protein SLEP1_g287 [Rubroshorea leprosula]